MKVLYVSNSGLHAPPCSFSPFFVKCQNRILHLKPFEGIGLCLNFEISSHTPGPHLMLFLGPEKIVLCGIHTK